MQRNQRRRARPWLVPAVVAAAALVATDAAAAAPTSGTLYAKALAAGKQAAKKSKAAGVVFTDRANGEPVLADVDGTSTDSVLNRLMHGDEYTAPRLAQRHRPGMPGRDFLSSEVHTLASGLTYELTVDAPPGVQPGSLWATNQESAGAHFVQRQIMHRQKNKAPQNQYYATDGVALENRGETRDGTYLVGLYYHTGIVRDGRKEFAPVLYRGDHLMSPAFAKGSDPEEILKIPRKFRESGATIVDAQQGLVRLKSVDTGNGTRARTVYGIVRPHPTSKDDWVLKDYWAGYDPSDVDPVVTKKLHPAVTRWATADGKEHKNKSSLATNDRSDAIYSFLHGVWGPRRSGSSANADQSSGARALGMPGPAFTGKKSSNRVELITNPNAARPKKAAAAVGVDRRAYFVSKSGAVRTWDVYDVAPDGTETPLGRSHSIDADLESAVGAMNATSQEPTRRAKIDERYQARWRYVDGAWLLVVADVEKDLIVSTAVVDPERYKGQGANWKPTL